MQATVGFLIFQLAFLLRGQDSVVWFGLILLFSAIGTMAGNASVPCCASAASHEEHMLELAFALIAIGGLVAAFGGGQVSAALLAGAVAVAAAFARLAFDAIVQRRARRQPRSGVRAVRDQVPDGLGPGCLRSRAHPHPRAVGFLIVTVLAAVAFVSYVVGWRRIREKPLPTLGGSGSVPRSRSDAGR